MECWPPGSSVHGISQARILEWVAISFPRDQTHVYWLGGRFFTTEPPRRPESSILLGMSALNTFLLLYTLFSQQSGQVSITIIFYLFFNYKTHSNNYSSQLQMLERMLWLTCRRCNQGLGIRRNALGQPRRLWSPLLYAPSLNKELIVFSIYRVFAMCQLLSALCILQHVYPCKNHVKWVLLASYFRKAETEDQEGNMIGY